MMRKAAFFLIAALAAPAAQAQEGPALTIAMGQEVTLTLDGAPRVTATAPAKPDAFEARAGIEFTRGDHDDAMGANAKPMTGEEIGAVTPEPVPGLIRLRMTPAPRNGTMLVIHNGYTQGLVYRATMRIGGKSQPTDVCLVMPGKLGVEHWPYAIAALELREMKLVAWKAEDGLPCA